MLTFRRRHVRVTPAPDPDPEKQFLLKEYKAQVHPSPRELVIQSNFDISVLNEIQTDQTIVSLECSGLSEDETLNLLQATSKNPNIHSLSFRECSFGNESKNILTELVPHRVIKKLGFEDCGLNDFDVVWLAYLIKSLHGICQLMLDENIHQDNMVKLYELIPLRTLNSLGLNARHLEDVPQSVYAGQHLTELDLIISEPLTDRLVEFLFDVIMLSKIESLKIRSFSTENEIVFKKFFALLRNDKQLKSLCVDGGSQVENEVLKLLLAMNITLIAFAGQSCRPGYGTATSAFIKGLIERNILINKTRALLDEFACESIEPDEKDECLTSLTLSLAELMQFVDPGYISTPQQTLIDLIREVKGICENNTPNDEKIIFSPARKRRLE